MSAKAEPLDFLERPVWSALSTRQAEFAFGGSLAQRFQADVEPFAATASDDEAALEALSALLTEGDSLLLMQAQPSPVPPGLTLISEAVGVQMIAHRRLTAAKPLGAVPLGTRMLPR